MNEPMFEENELGRDAILSNSIAPIKEESEEEGSNILWRMNFDGAHSRSGTGAGIVLTSPNGEVLSFALRLEYEGTNNAVEYVALILGLEVAKDRGIKVLKIIGDSD